MPYIKPEDRICPDVAAHEGNLNFMITKLVDEFIARRGLNYSTINTVIGVLECAKLELYRRIAAPYEDTKLKLNGDVYRPEHVKGH